VATWSFLLADHAGNALAELSTATGRVLTFARNGVPEARMTISHDDDAAGLLLDALNNGIPTLRAYRDGVLRFHGYLAPFSEELEEDAKLNLVFRGPFSRLLGDGTGRGRFVTASYSSLDAGQIAKQLIDAAQAGGTAGVATNGSIEATKTRDRTYENVNVGEAVVNLTNVLDGFDFEVVPIEFASGSIGQFVVYASQGMVQPQARFEYGPDTMRNVRKVSRQMQPPVNTARVFGNGSSVVRTDAASILAFGVWEMQESLADVSELATLHDRAEAMLRPQWIRVVSFTPEPVLAPAPWDDYWLGDTVSFYGWRGAFEEATSSRISKITVVVDDEGNESSEVEDPGFAGARLESRVETEVVDFNPIVRRNVDLPLPGGVPLLLPFTIPATIGS
jgi:hypothetical protein